MLAHPMSSTTMHFYRATMLNGRTISVSTGTSKGLKTRSLLRWAWLLHEISTTSVSAVPVLNSASSSPPNKVASLQTSSSSATSRSTSTPSKSSKTLTFPNPLRPLSFTATLVAQDPEETGDHYIHPWIGAESVEDLTIALNGNPEVRRAFERDLLNEVEVVHGEFVPDHTSSRIHGSQMNTHHELPIAGRRPALAPIQQIRYNLMLENVSSPEAEKRVLERLQDVNKVNHALQSQGIRDVHFSKFERDPLYAYYSATGGKLREAERHTHVALVEVNKMGNNVDIASMASKLDGGKFLKEFESRVDLVSQSMLQLAKRTKRQCLRSQAMTCFQAKQKKVPNQSNICGEMEKCVQACLWAYTNAVLYKAAIDCQKGLVSTDSTDLEKLKKEADLSNPNTTDTTIAAGATKEESSLVELQRTALPLNLFQQGSMTESFIALTGRHGHGVPDFVKSLMDMGVAATMQLVLILMDMGVDATMQLGAVNDTKAGNATKSASVGTVPIKLMEYAQTTSTVTKHIEDIENNIAQSVQSLAVKNGTSSQQAVALDFRKLMGNPKATNATEAAKKKEDKMTRTVVNGTRYYTGYQDYAPFAEPVICTILAGIGIGTLVVTAMVVLPGSSNEVPANYGRQKKRFWFF